MDASSSVSSSSGLLPEPTMTKTLLLLRHAKSSWKDHSLRDHDRPLNKRGERDAPRMGRLVRENGLVPSIIVSSTATRARSTAHAAAEASGFDGLVIETEALYHALAEDIAEVVRDVPEPHAVAMIVSHNPGLEDAIAYFAGAYEIMPTGALAHIELDVETWAEVDRSTGRLNTIWRPRELDDE